DSCGPWRAACSRTPPGSRELRSQVYLHSVPGDFDPAAVELRPLGGVLVENGVGVVHVDQNLARGGGQQAEPLQHAAGAAQREMAHVTRPLARKAEPDHLVVAPERAV